MRDFLKKYVFAGIFILCFHVLISCGSDGSNVDELLGTGGDTTVIEVPPENNLVITIDTPSSGDPVGYQKSISGTCGTAGLPIEIYGDVSGFSACGLGGTWSASIDTSASGAGTVTVNARILDGDIEGNPATITLNKISTACDTEAARNDTFANTSTTGVPPWEICTTIQFSNMTTYAGDDATILNDLDFGGGTLQAMGNTTTGYSGTMEGNNFTISNVNINSTATQQGFFRELAGATFQNMNIENMSVTGDQYVGVFAGYVDTGTQTFTNITMTNITLHSNEAGNDAFVGSLFGRTNNTTISVVATDITINNINITSIKNYQGGLVGQFRSTSGTLDFDNIIVNGGEIQGRSNVGGVIAHIDDSLSEANLTFNKILNTADITATNSNVGGVGGRARGIFVDVANTGTVTRSSTGTNYGGILGYIRRGSISGSSAAATRDATIVPPAIPTQSPPSLSGGLPVSCYNTGNVVATGGNYTGGVIGNAHSDITGITSCYNTGNISGGDEYIGGIVGRCDGVDINDSFNTGNIIGTRNYVGGIAGRIRNTGGPSLTNTYSSGMISASGATALYIGGLIGYWEGSGGLTDVWFNGSIVVIDADDSGQVRYVGGLVGNYVHTGSDCTRCSSAGTMSLTTGGTFVNDHRDVGGLMGYNRSDIVDSSSTMDISAPEFRLVGGIAGYDNSRDTTNTTYRGEITARTRLGGIFGQVAGANTDIVDCSVEADITATATSGDGYAGGITGYGGADIRSSYYAGTITAIDLNYVGGIEGGVNSNQNRGIFSSFSTGTINAGDGTYVGGISGYVHSRTDRLINNFSTATVIGGDEVGGLYGRLRSRGNNSVRYSYAANQVIRATGSTSTDVGYVVGLVSNGDGTVSSGSNYYNSELPPLDESTSLPLGSVSTLNVLPLDNDDMLDENLFVNFDFALPEWQMPSGTLVLPGESGTYAFPVQEWVE